MGYGAITVGTGATLIVAANTKRQVLHITNMSEVQICWIGPDENITTGNAIPLYETQTRDQTKDFGSWLGPVYGITNTGSAVTVNVRYWEVER